MRAASISTSSGGSSSNLTNSAAPVRNIANKLSERAAALERAASASPSGDERATLRRSGSGSGSLSDRIGAFEQLGGSGGSKASLVVGSGGLACANFRPHHWQPKK